MPLFKKLATLATAAAAARSYAKKNPDQASKYVDQAAQFVDKQTKGKYSSQITGAAAQGQVGRRHHRDPGRRARPTNGYVARPALRHRTGPARPRRPRPDDHARARRRPDAARRSARYVPMAGA